MKFDFWIFISSLLLSLIGIFLIYSAVFGTSLEKLYLRQGAFLCVAIGVMVILWKIPVRLHDGMAYIYYIAIILVLFVVLLQNADVKRWLALGPIRVQPSEFSKLVMILVIGRWFRDHLKSLSSPITIGMAILLILPPFFLVIMEPDLGTGMVFFVMLFFMMYGAGVRPLHIFLILTPILAMVSAFHWIAWTIYFVILLFILIRWRTSPTTFITTIIVAISVGLTTPYVWAHLHPYQKERIMVFLNPSYDPFGAGYQLIQSKIAIGSGGVLGKGFLHGTQIKLAFLPAKHSDFIFAVLGEQFGFVGCFIVIFLYFILLWRILKIASQSRMAFGSIVAFGIAAVIFFQVSINIAMTLGLAPITGIPLPFLSSGGSSLVVFWAMIGILQNIYSQGVVISP
ncbi:rod shape-determining protein RodA [bacterium]|nr:rod shape-determining protein RodA [bacterium]